MNVNDPASFGLADDELPLATWWARGREWTEAALAQRLPPAERRPTAVHSAMRYACLGGGKRLRTLLTLAACHDQGGSLRQAFLPALAVEIFHAYTLIHDDLPCMDDDDLRRGKPSTHIQFGEANALLAGDALLTLACEWCAHAYAPLPHPPGMYVMELCRAGGSEGVIGGQVEDLAATGAAPNLEDLQYIHREKTARLLACACRMGTVAAGACEAHCEKIGTFAMELGLAFQIRDDLLDATGATGELGKPVGSDQNKGKMTYVALMGVEAAREEEARHTRQALEQLETLGLAEGRLAQITHALLDRRH